MKKRLRHWWLSGCARISWWSCLVESDTVGPDCAFSPSALPHRTRKNSICDLELRLEGVGHRRDLWRIKSGHLGDARWKFG